MAFHKKFAHIEEADKLNLSLSLKQIENTADIYRYMLKCNFLVWKLLCFHLLNLPVIEWVFSRFEYLQLQNFSASNCTEKKKRYLVDSLQPVLYDFDIMDLAFYILLNQ